MADTTPDPHSRIESLYVGLAFDAGAVRRELLRLPLEDVVDMLLGVCGGTEADGEVDGVRWCLFRDSEDGTKDVPAWRLGAAWTVLPRR